MQNLTLDLTDKAVIEQASNHFYSALNALFVGNDQPMREVWSHANDVVYLGPDGLYLVGWEKIAQMWSHHASLKLGGAVKPSDLHLIISKDISMITCIEAGANEHAGKSESVGIRSSTVFRKENGAWMVIAHQTDLLNFMN